MTTKNLQQGVFIVFEGLDRSGKTTSSDHLIQSLQKIYQTKKITFPNRTTPIGQLLNKYLLGHIELPDQSVHLLFSANRWEIANEIIADLKAGIIIIADRYSASNIAFSSSKGLDIDWCAASEAGLPSPDLTVFMNLTPLLASKRSGYGDQITENLTFQEKFYQQYQKLIDDSWLIIDPTHLSQEQIDTHIYHAVIQKINS